MRMCSKLATLVICLAVYWPIFIVSFEVEVWEHFSHKGKSAKLNVSNCVNVPKELAGRVSSVNTSTCASFYSGKNCSGESIEILPDSPNRHNLQTWSFNNLTISVGPCLDLCDDWFDWAHKIPVQVTAFTKINYNGDYEDIPIKGCTPVPEICQNISSIQTNGICVQLWRNSDCISRHDRDYIEIRTKTPKHKLDEWNFGRVLAISNCAQINNCDKNDSRRVVHHLAVNKNELQIFHEVQFKGKQDTITLTKGCNNLGESSKGKAKSVKIGTNVCLCLYDRKDCRGRRTEVTDWTPNLQDFVVRSVKFCDMVPGQDSSSSDFLHYVSVVGLILLCLTVIGFVVSIVSLQAVMGIKRQIFLSEREMRDFLDGVCPSSEILGVDNRGYIEYEITNNNTNIDIQNTALSLAYNGNYEINRNLFSLDGTLGAGHYGIVYKGVLKNSEGFQRTVAIKTTKCSSTVVELRCLMKEVKVMLYIAELGAHANIVSVIGCCTELLKSSGDLYMIMEYYSNGSLESYLRANRTNARKPDKFKMFGWMAEISSGMEFLSASKIVHRDLSTRNVLLDENFHAKICDFGLSRQLYENTRYLQKGRDPMAWQWLPIEAIFHSTFTTKSDVWSFGVLCWEILTLGEEPFAGEKWGKEFIDKLKLGHRLPRPIGCSQNCYQLMLDCWQEEPTTRPEFAQITQLLLCLKNTSDGNEALRSPENTVVEGYVESFVTYV